MPQHTYFNYLFSDDNGIYLGDQHWKYNYDMAIYYGSGGSYIDCRCSRWDVQDYTIIVESWLKKDEIQELRNNITPGAVGELYQVLGKPHYYDKTWQGQNTIKILPTPSSVCMPGSTLKSMRNSTVCYVKNYTEHPVSNTDWIEIKIEAMVSANQSL